MKKFTFSLMLLCALFVMCTPSVQANGQADYPVGKNYLDLRNLVVYDDGNYMANTALPIFVKVDQPYTLVLGYEFLGQHASYIDQFTVVIVDVMNVHDGYDFIDDMQNERAYIEFTSDTEWIHLRNLPCMPESYEAMLYEGTYAQFPGFEPYLKAEEKLILYGGLAIDYDERLSLPQIQSYITSKDPLGNVLTVSLIADEYTHSTQLPGTYQMIFSSIYNSIEKWFYLDVRVFDITAPIITIPSSLQISYSQRLTLMEIKQQIQVFDNVDDLSHEDLVVLSDTYSGATTIGTYEITVEATDMSANQTTLTFEVEIVDDQGPHIDGPKSIFIYTEDIPFTNQQIIDRFEIIDDVDGTNVTTQIIQNQYLQTRTPGIYQVSIRSTDQQGNQTTKHIRIHVVNNTGPSFEIDEIILNLDTVSHMDESELVDWFRTHLNKHGYQATQLQIVYNEYENNHDEEGTYYVYLSYQVGDNDYVSRIQVIVEDESFSILSYAYYLILVPIFGISFYFVKRKFKKR